MLLIADHEVINRFNQFLLDCPTENNMNRSQRVLDGRRAVLARHRPLDLGHVNLAKVTHADVRVQQSQGAQQLVSEFDVGAGLFQVLDLIQILVSQPNEWRLQSISGATPLFLSFGDGAQVTEPTTGAFVFPRQVLPLALDGSAPITARVVEPRRLDSFAWHQVGLL